MNKDKLSCSLRLSDINKTIEDKSHNINHNTTRLASMATSAEDLEKCSKFIKEVKMVRFNKVKNRHIRKFSNLLNKSRALDNNRQVNLARQDNNATRHNRQASNAGDNNSKINSNNNNNRDSNRDNLASNKWVINFSKQN